MYKNYIFDLYGTLLDIHTNESKGYLWKKMAELYCSFGAHYSAKELHHDYLSLVSRLEHSMNHQDPEIKLEQVFYSLFIQKEITPDALLISYIGITFRIISRDYICVYPHVLELLQLLKTNGKKIYLLSNAQRIFTESELKESGLLPFFDGIYLSSDFGYKKPNASFLNSLLDVYHLEPKDCIMIGNELKSDIAVANACSIDSLFIHSNPAVLISEPILATYQILDGDIQKIAPMILK